MKFENKIDIYNHYFYTFFDLNSLNKFLKKCGVETPVENKRYDGLVYTTDSGVLAVYINPVDLIITPHVINTICHESFHLMDNILETKGLELIAGSGNEHLSYLIGHISQCIYENLEIYIKKQNKE